MINKKNDYETFTQELNVIKFIIQNMDKIIKKGICFTDVIEAPMRHPHYYSRIVTELGYNYKEEILVHCQSNSGSPGCWNEYENEHPLNIWEIAQMIADDIRDAKRLEEESNPDKVAIEYKTIEGF